MRPFLFAATLAAALPLGSTISRAGRAEADSCAARLPANARQIYVASIDSVRPDVDLRELVRSKTRSLVIGGQLSRGEAQAAAEAAGACLEQAR
jgi:hypothetical protein